MSVPASDIAMITFNDVPAINTSLKYDMLGVLDREPSAILRAPRL